MHLLDHVRSIQCTSLCGCSLSYVAVIHTQSHSVYMVSFHSSCSTCCTPESSVVECMIVRETYGQAFVHCSSSHRERRSFCICSSHLGADEMQVPDQASKTRHREKDGVPSELHLGIDLQPASSSKSRIQLVYDLHNTAIAVEELLQVLCAEGYLC